ncbi:MAG TPA: hypothetical protein VFD59_21210 [Nocardioidaceae bacterium]|nr:hypothetical protein [Nocardioidaceae bacterium]
MTQLLHQDVWNDRDFPILSTVCAHFEEHGRGPNAKQVEIASGLSPKAVQRAGKNLARDGLVTVTSSWGLHVLGFSDVSGDALRLVGLWPTPETAYGRMVEALDRTIENTDDEAQRTRAQRIRDEVTGAGEAVGIDLATAIIAGSPGH